MTSQAIGNHLPIDKYNDIYGTVFIKHNMVNCPRGTFCYHRRNLQKFQCQIESLYIIIIYMTEYKYMIVDHIMRAILSKYRVIVYIINHINFKHIKYGEERKKYIELNYLQTKHKYIINLNTLQQKIITTKYKKINNKIYL